MMTGKLLILLVGAIFGDLLVAWWCASQENVILGLTLIAIECVTLSTATFCMASRWGLGPSDPLSFSFAIFAAIGWWLQRVWTFLSANYFERFGFWGIGFLLFLPAVFSSVLMLFSFITTRTAKTLLPFLAKTKEVQNG